MTPQIDELAELHGELREVARDLFGKNGAADWRVIARSGWLGLEAPAAFDGADATFAEVAVVLQEAGRAAAPGPYPAVAALALGALTLLEPSPTRDRLLRATVAGDAVPILALPGDAAGGPPPFTVRGPLLHGEADFVLGAPAADHLLVPALDPDGRIVIVDVDRHGPGPAVAERPVVDATRGFGRVLADGVTVGPHSRWCFRGDPRDAWRRLGDRAAVAVACDSLGLSEAMLDATVAHVRARHQFGRPIGSFQAVKHACADMLVHVTMARRLVATAVRGVAADDPGASAAASMAKAYACSAAVDVAGGAMQLHGGMGYTWESGVHVYLKRAALNRSLFGPPASHRARLAERYETLATEAGA